MHVIKNLKKVVNQQTFTIINSKGIHHFPGGSDDKESTCRRPQFDSWLGKIRWRRDRLTTPAFVGFPGASAGKESACSAGDLGSIPGLGRSPGGGKDYLLQYSGLENSMDCIVHGVAKSWTRLSNFHSLTQGIILSEVQESLFVIFIDFLSTLFFKLIFVGSFGLRGGSDSNASACNAGDPGLIPGSGRYPGKGNGYPLQYSCLANHMDRGAYSCLTMFVELVSAEQQSESAISIHIFPLFFGFPSHLGRYRALSRVFCRFLLVIYSIYSINSVCMSILTPQFTPSTF